MAPTDVLERSEAEEVAQTHDGNTNAEDVAAGGTVNTEPVPMSSRTFTSAQASSQTSTSTSTSTSSSTTPRPSREPSPARSSMRPSVPSNTRAARSRKNSQDSPTRPTGHITHTTPSAASVQRALLNNNNKPQFHPPPTAAGAAAESFSEPTKHSKTGGRHVTENVHHWPVSPRLKSPPPSTPHQSSLSSLASLSSIPVRRSDHYDSSTPTPTPPTPNIIVEPVNSGSVGSKDTPSRNELEAPENKARSAIRATGRGASGTGPALETVHEASLPATPAAEQGADVREVNLQGNGQPRPLSKLQTESSRSSIRASNESGSESGGNRSSGMKNDEKALRKASIASTTSKLSTVLPAKRSYTGLNATRDKPGGEGSMRNMTVETETVSSIPQVALAGIGDRGLSGRVDHPGSLRLKASNETIRPSRKKPKRKAPSVTSGTASSKADIFEAKVASAVDEANSSDSEETFVYESNPPDSRTSRPTRYHSRTPSATSMASQADQHVPKTRQQMLIDGTHSIAGKKSMKFANTHNFDDDTGNSSFPRKINGLGAHRHHHIGRFGRNGGGHASLFDNDSLFPNAPKGSRMAGGTILRSSRPASPRSAHHFRTIGSPRKPNDLNTYDIEGEGADDERTPLVGSVKSGRSRHGRRLNSSNIIRYEYEHPRSSCCSRWLPCLMIMALLMVLVCAFTAFIFALSRPLLDVSIKHIQDVLASEQEIMLDLDVRATNPNMFAISVTDLDVNIFAKSKYVGSERFWRDNPPMADVEMSRPEEHKRGDSVVAPRDDSERLLHALGGIDEGNDPIEDPSGDLHTMLLGRVFEFDSPLTFDPSPLHPESHSSVGQVRLAKPGNETEAGGTERWENVLQHQFELIIRGVLKYQLPLSSHSRSAPIGASVTVYPQDDDKGTNRTDSSGKFRISRITPLPPDTTPSNQKSPRYRSIKFRA
ncbi:MAG: hypothetical protein M1834_003756 [Cirrosporium novae-zelandiae]|nr:MAG: hypothetical protein M1834_003756 [Cirrosporium novae-zelandiae]